MRPELFSIGPITVHTFGLMMALGFIAAGVTSYYGFKRKGLDAEKVYWLVIAAAVGGLLGSKLHYIILHLDQLKGDPLSTAFSGAGLVWYGGLIGGMLAGFITILILKLPLAKVLDAAAPAVAIGYAFGRMGCFLNGDDYGRPSSLPWAMEFPEGSPPTAPGVAVQPTQLYESFSSLLIFLVLLWLWPRLKRDWELFCAYLAMAGTERFLVEFVRATEGRQGQTQQQLLALGTAIVAGLVLIWIHTRPEPR
jgi:phosphatidylglycerol:prolipoprotein diacylglycerol transferase